VHDGQSKTESDQSRGFADDDQSSSGFTLIELMKWIKTMPVEDHQLDCMFVSSSLLRRGLREPQSTDRKYRPLT
jgi:hypothetical protein